jgi:hypothetical protein
LDQAGGGDQVAGAGELDGGEINADDPQPMISQFAGRRQADTAAQVSDRGAGGQQAGQFRNPAGIAADVLCGRGGRLAVIIAVGNGNGVVAAADKITLRRPCRLRRGNLIISSDEGDLNSIAAAVSRRLGIDRP